MKTTWTMNGAHILSRAGSIIKKMFADFQNEGRFVLHTEQDEPNYLRFYDIYGNKHEIIVEG